MISLICRKNSLEIKTLAFQINYSLSYSTFLTTGFIKIISNSYLESWQTFSMSHIMVVSMAYQTFLFGLTGITSTCQPPGDFIFGKFSKCHHIYVLYWRLWLTLFCSSWGCIWCNSFRWHTQMLKKIHIILILCCCSVLNCTFSSINNLLD